MPEKLHKRLKKQAKQKGLRGKRAKAYIYGTMQAVKTHAMKK